jgi:NADH-quinone oxidoreductase subunit G
MATIEIDGKTFEVENGKMIIEVADEAGIPIPRFCYHKKLSVAANCRMCLVEISNSKKTVPACATPINDGMKVYTQSAAALKSQKAVMEFLLINHPLDCPICDQGGECELQDVSMGYGESEGDYTETKRAVDDKSLGTLIATEMTRCIHCTRCVRFGEEIAGLREMGAPGRGEHVEIGTYVEKSLVSEISGNIIDLCPVGALTSKPYRYTARSWELTQTPGVAPHDCLGSNIFLHIRRGKLMRVVPRENEAINETWASDRDRFSYTANYHAERLAQPMLKQKGQWKAVDWATALNFVASKLGEVLAKNGPESVAAFASPSSTTEELYVLQKWMRALKVNNLDFRLRQKDFSGDQYLVAQNQNTLNYAELENQNSILLMGTHLQREVPLAMAKVRKAFINGAKITSLNICDYPMTASVHASIVDEPLAFEKHLLALIEALNIKVEGVPASWTKDIKLEKKHQEIAKTLKAEKATIVTGSIFENHPRYHVLRYLIEQICQNSDIKYLHLSTGANSEGAWTAGFVPHLEAAGAVAQHNGLNVFDALNQNLKAYILHGVESDFDFDDANLAEKAFNQAEFVVAVSSFKTESLLRNADVLLPMATFAETSGTYINVDKTWQSFEGAAQPFDAARPAWKIYRVLANLSHCDGFDYSSSNELLTELQELSMTTADAKYQLPKDVAPTSKGVYRVAEVALYGTDMFVRHSLPLQNSASADQINVKMSPKLAHDLGIKENLTMIQGQNELTLPAIQDDGLAENVIITPAACKETKTLGSSFTAIEVK